MRREHFVLEPGKGIRYDVVLLTTFIYWSNYAISHRGLKVTSTLKLLRQYSVIMLLNEHSRISVL